MTNAAVDISKYEWLSTTSLCVGDVSRPHLSRHDSERVVFPCAVLRRQLLKQVERLSLSSPVTLFVRLPISFTSSTAFCCQVLAFIIIIIIIIVKTIFSIQIQTVVR